MTRGAGLSAEQAAAILRADGPNEIFSRRKSAWWSSLRSVVREPMVLVLFLCALIYLVIGEPIDALILLSSILVVGGISFFQEFKTEKSLAALRQLSSPRALVRRDGQLCRIPGREVVVGDVLVLREGDRVAADAVVIEGTGLMIDESLLTGESLAVMKFASPVDLPPDEAHRVFSGTLIVRGNGVAEVSATGVTTKLGEISGLLSDIDEKPSHLQQQAAQFARQIGVIAVVVCLIAIVLYGNLKGSWISAILAGLTLAVALMPEELPLIITLFSAMGAWRMSKRHMLTRKVSAVESLGAVQVLCSDKTGTMTQNKMEIAGTWTTAGYTEAKLLQTFYEASDEEVVDPMECAVAGRVTDKNRALRLFTFPLSPEILAMTNVRRDGENFWMSSKGAVEALLSFCDLGAQARDEIIEQADRWAATGIRVLAVAEKTGLSGLPTKWEGSGFRFVGLVGFSDPIRPEVPAAVRQCHSMGIRVAMMTGDYPTTALAIAREAGLVAEKDAAVLTGAQIEVLSEEDLLRRVMSTRVYARINPHQKLRIVRAYQRHGLKVAMTGDGVNDGPSLKAADVGVAMGGRGTDVAREAADLVLLDDNFSTIVDCVAVGRGIFLNIQNAAEFVVAVHVPIALLALVQALIDIPMMLFPIHVVLLELIVDPACTLVFEASSSDEDVRGRAPAARVTSLLTSGQIWISCLHGLVLFAATLGVAYHFRAQGHQEAQVRALTYLALSVSFLGAIVGRLHSVTSLLKMLRNTWLLGILMAYLGAVLTVLWFPGAKELLRFEAVPISEVALVATLGFFGGYFVPVLQSLWGRLKVLMAAKTCQSRSDSEHLP